jgi:hypothetical protein
MLEKSKMLRLVSCQSRDITVYTERVRAARNHAQYLTAAIQ